MVVGKSGMEGHEYGCGGRGGHKWWNEHFTYLATIKAFRF